MCGSETEWLWCWSCDQQVAGLKTGLHAVECNLGQVVNTYVPLSPSCIIWYQPMGSDALQLGRSGIALESHWPHIMDISVSLPTGSRPRRGRWASDYALLVEYGELNLYHTHMFIPPDLDKCWHAIGFICWRCSTAEHLPFTAHSDDKQTGTVLTSCRNHEVDELEICLITTQVHTVAR